MFRIQRSRSIADLDNIAKELVGDRGNWPDALLSALVAKIREGVRPSTTTLAEAVVATQNRDLYHSARSELLGSVSSCHYLLTHAVPDPAIEESLCAKLPELSTTWRTTIVRALGEHGTNGCRDTLSALEYEVHPASNTSKEVLNSLSPEDLNDRAAIIRTLDHREIVFFYETVLSSLRSVVARNRPPPTEWQENSVDHPGFFDIAESHFQRAETHLQRQNEESEAMGDLRKATEALLKAWIKQVACADARPLDLDSLQLEKLNNLLTTHVKPPKAIVAISVGIQHATNPATHDQGVLEESEFLSRNIAEGHMDGWRQLHRYAVKTLSRGQQF
jgi:hypothetical protein